MNIDFKTEKLRALCEQEKEARKELGAKSAKKLRRRLADIMAATNVCELLAGKPHPLRHDREGQFAVNLDGGCRLIFVPAHNPVPTKKDGAINWCCVTSVVIIEIGDYHD